MKFFVSSLITGMEAERAAAVEAIEGLGHQATRAEDFSASPDSPRVACLKGVHDCDGLVLIASSRYGQRQQSGKSATHEEYDAAADSKPIFVFVDEKASPDPDQANFLSQIQDWQSGGFTARYTSPASLRQQISKAIHSWELSQAAGRFDAAEATHRAIDLLPRDRGRYSSGATMALAIASGPAQSVIRPAEIDAHELRRHISQAALFGTSPIFTPAQATNTSVEGHMLWLRQETNAFGVDEQGAMILVRELVEGNGSGMMAVIQEEVETQLASSLTFASAMLDHIDADHRLTHAALAVNLYEASYRGWRTRAEHAAQPTSGTMNMIHGESRPITLQPPHRPRGAMLREANKIAQDLTVLLKRNWTGK